MYCDHPSISIFLKNFIIHVFRMSLIEYMIEKEKSF